MDDDHMPSFSPPPLLGPSMKEKHDFLLKSGAIGIDLAYQKKIW